MATVSVARAAGSAAVWNTVRDVIAWLESPGVRDMKASQAADHLAKTFERETHEPAR